VGYFTQSDLESALSVVVVKAAYDDDHDGAVDAAPIAACIAYGSAMCDSFLRNVLVSSSGAPLALPLSTVPDEVKFAALDFGIAYTIRRRPDIVRAMSEQPWTVFYEQAIEQMKRYCASMQRITPTGLAHATAGGSIRGRDVDDDVAPEPRWAKMGDFS
jgi:hypothetical protein